MVHLKTTLNEMRVHKPCESGWDRLLSFLGKTKADDDPIDLMYILNSNGLEDVAWTLRCFNYLDICLFLADVAEIALPIFESAHPEDLRPRKAIRAIRAYKAGEISESDLLSASRDAFAAAVGAASHNLDIHYPLAAIAARAAAHASDCTAIDAAEDALAAAKVSVAAVTNDIDPTTPNTVGYNYVRRKITMLFIKRFGSDPSKDRNHTKHQQ